MQAVNAVQGKIMSVQGWLGPSKNSSEYGRVSARECIQAMQGLLVEKLAPGLVWVAYVPSSLEYQPEGQPIRTRDGFCHAAYSVLSGLELARMVH